MSPQAFDQVQTWAVGRQPEDLDAVLMGLEPRLHRFRMMEPTVITNQADFPPRVGSDQRHQEQKEIRAALGIGDRGGRFTRRIIHTPVDHFLLVLAWSRDLGLSAHRRPHACQGRMLMNFNLVLEDQGLGCILGQRFFLSRRSWLLAFW